MTAHQDGPAAPDRPDVVRLRRAERPDADRIVAVFLASRAAAMPYLPHLHDDEETAAWISGVVLPGTTAWVAESGEPPEIVGFAALDGTVLEHLYLRPDVRRRGIGSALLQAVKQASPGELSLQVFQRNEAARAFYERHGFTAVEYDDGTRNEENEPDVTYRWTSQVRSEARSRDGASAWQGSSASPRRPDRDGPRAGEA